MPKKQAVPSGKGAAEFLSATPMPSRRIGQETQRLGKVLSGFGGTLGDLAGKLQQLAYIKDKQDAQLEDIETYRTKLDELNKDPELATRAEKYNTWQDAEDTRIIGKVKSERAREDLAAEFARRKIARSLSIEATANKLMAQDIIVRREMWMHEMAKQYAESSEEKKETIRTDVQDRLDDEDEAGLLLSVEGETAAIKEALFESFVEEAEKIAYENLTERTLSIALGILDKYDEEAAIDYLMDKEQTGLENKETKRLISDIKFQADYNEFNQRSIDQKKRAEEITNILGNIGTTSPSDIETSGNLNITDQGIFKRLLTNWSTIPETDWRRYNDLIDLILSDKEDNTSLQLKIAEARGGASDKKNRYLSQDDFVNIQKMLDLDMKPETRSYLKMGFDNIRRKSKATGGYWPLLSPLRESQKEAESAAKARAAFLSQVQDRIMRKKETTLEDTYKISSEQATAHRSGAESRADILRIMPGLPEALKTQIKDALNNGIPASEILKADELQEYLKKTK